MIFAGRDNPGSLGAWPALSGIEIVLLSLVSVLLLLAGAVLWTLFHVLQQNGRLLLRLEAVEKNLKIDPEAKAARGHTGRRSGSRVRADRISTARPSRSKRSRNPNCRLC